MFVKNYRLHWIVGRANILCKYIIYIFFNFGCGFCDSFIMLFPKAPASCYICHWNLNIITAHNFIKVSLLIAYNSIGKCDAICLSKTYLDSSTILGDDNLEIPGYSLVRCDYSSNTKCGRCFCLLQIVSLFKSFKYETFARVFKY